MEKRADSATSAPTPSDDPPASISADAPVIEPSSVFRRTLGSAIGTALQFGFVGILLGAVGHIALIAGTAGFAAVTLPGVVGIAALGGMIAAGLGLVAGTLSGLASGTAQKIREKSEETVDRPIPLRSQGLEKTQAVEETKDIQQQLVREQNQLRATSAAALPRTASGKVGVSAHKMESPEFHEAQASSDPTNKPENFWQNYVRPNRTGPAQQQEVEGMPRPSNN